MENKLPKLSMNDGYILVKRSEQVNNFSGFIVTDAPGNAVKGVVVETSDNSRFKVGHIAYCAGGTDIKINGETFLVVPFDKIFFTYQS